MENLIQPFENERKQTDKSLDVERGKTDQSFETYKDKAESKTDKIISENRVEADDARSMRRSKSDLKNESMPSDIIGQKNQHADQQNLHDERKSEDNAIKTERLKNDLAFEHERSENERLLSKIVSLEREATDKNLLKERKKADTERVRSAEIFDHECKAHLETKSALTTREEFVAIVSHDLRNPIGAILSFSEILLEDSSMREINSEAKQYIEIIKRSAESSLRLISDILDMERIEGGKIHLQLAVHNLSDIIIECVEGFRHIAATKKITLKAEEINLKDPINCDKDRLVQVISNLICNAVKFTPQNGAVTVKVEHTESEIKISIVDTGPGVPDEQKNRIFDRFAQLGNKDRRGLGLGLYISKTLVESHNGKIWVISEPNKGSTFCFTLPR